MLVQSDTNSSQCIKKNRVQSNLCTTTTLALQNSAVLTGGCCSKISLCYKSLKWDLEMVAVIGRRLLFRGSG